MNPREDIAGLSQQFAHRLAAMVDARLLTYREYMPWADSLILAMNHAPKWVLDLAVTTYPPAALEVSSAFANSEAFNTLTKDAWIDEYIAAIYLRYARRELSWASALEEIGGEADARGGERPCEYFYEMLNQYEESEFSEAIEAEQRALIEREYEQVIRSVRSTFNGIRASRKRDKSKRT